MHAEATKHVLLGRKSLGCPAAISRSGRNDRGGGQTWGPEHNEMAAVSKKRSVVKSFDGKTREADLDSERGKADDVEEETGMCTPRDRRDRGPGTQGRIRGIDTVEVRSFIGPVSALRSKPIHQHNPSRKRAHPPRRRASHLPVKL